MMRHIFAASLVVAAVATSSAAQAPEAQPLFTLDGDGGGAPATLTHDDTVFRTDVVFHGTAAGDAKVEVVSFEATVVLLEDCKLGHAKNVIAIKLAPGGSMPICLQAPMLAAGGKVTGRIALSTSTTSSAAPIYRTLTLQRSKPGDGILTLDRNVTSQTVSRPAWPWPFQNRASAEASVALGEKTNAVGLQGVFVRLEQVTASPESGFDLARNVSFEFNGKEKSLARLSPDAKDASDQNLAPGGRATVRLLFHDLDPGDYTAIFRFSAVNSTPDDAQKLTATIHVRDSIVWAVSWLMLALLLSLLSTTLLVSQRRRASIIQQINSLPPMWLSSLPTTAAVTWVRASLHQVRHFTKHWRPTIPLSVDATVSDVRKMLGVLDNIRQIREKMQLVLDPLIFNRAIALLYRVAERVGPTALDDAEVAAINADLKTFDGWVSEERFPATCWNAIRPAVETLRDRLQRNPLPADVKTMVDEGLKAIADALTTAPATKAAVLEVYRQYIRLHLLVEHRDNLEGLLPPAATMDIHRLFELTDLRDWEKLKASKLTLRMPDSSGDNLEAFQILRFAVETEDPSASESFLFHNKVEFRWIFKVVDPAVDPAGEQFKTRLTPRGIGPAIQQYFPAPGKLSVKVDLVYKGDILPVPWVAGPQIQKSSVFQAFRIDERSAITSWGLAALVALATGLSTLYFKGTSWGSFQDYVTMFLWGVGVDQGKNFIQAMQFTSGQSSTPAANGH